VIEQPRGDAGGGQARLHPSPRGRSLLPVRHPGRGDRHRRSGTRTGAPSGPASV